MTARIILSDAILEARSLDQPMLVHMAAAICLRLPSGPRIANAWFENGRAAELARELIGIIADTIEADNAPTGDLMVRAIESGTPDDLAQAVADWLRTSCIETATPPSDDAPTTADIMREELNEALGRPEDMNP
jgi:hypothetical protein